MKGNLRPTALLLALMICASAASCGNTDGGTADKAAQTQSTTTAADAEEGIPAKEDAMEVLKAVSSKEGTRWSAIYDLDDFEVEACFNADYENKYEFKGTE